MTNCNHTQKDFVPGAYLSSVVTSLKCRLCGETHYYAGANRVYHQWELNAALAEQQAQIAQLVTELQNARAEVSRLQETIFEVAK